MDLTREERLAATQRVYEEWSEVTDFVTDDLASDEDEAKLLDTMVEQGLIQP
jgi:hypothetical protein